MGVDIRRWVVPVYPVRAPGRTGRAWTGECGGKWLRGGRRESADPQGWRAVLYTEVHHDEPLESYHTIQF